jgi:phospholipase C
MFDHMPPPAPPSFNADGSLAGGSTLKLDGAYFSDPKREHLLKEDTISGTVRPWGLGPRVPMHVISPWSRGGWVNSQTFDHTSVGQFLEKRFAITIPGICPWHRAVCGDMVSAFDFVSPNDTAAPRLPDTSGSAALVEQASKRPKPSAPIVPEKLFQERGSRPSRALPYVLHVEASRAGNSLQLAFRNEGTAGAVFHVYDRAHLDRIPRRYTVEAGRDLADRWIARPDGRYDLWVLGPGGFIRTFEGDIAHPSPYVTLIHHPAKRSIELRIVSPTDAPGKALLVSSVYEPATRKRIAVPARQSVSMRLDVSRSGNWYDVTLTQSDFVRRLAGRLETGRDSISDPAMGLG